MITLERIADLPKNTLYREVEGELPPGIEADFLYVTPTLKINKYFIIFKTIEEVLE